MNLTRCEHGHFYDVDKFAVCPHCQNQGDAEVTLALDKRGLNETEPLTVAAENAGVTISQKPGSVQPTTPFQPNPGSVNTVPPVGMPQMNGMPQPTANPGMMNPFPEPVTPLTEESTMSVREDSKTISIYSVHNTKTEPVVGWLVCVDGAHFGESFNLKAGRNFIGRSSTMDVVLSQDKSVSREKHATILFEPRKREFLAQPGESRELFYVNDEVVLNAQKLDAYDVISVGNCKLIFVPFCNSEFGWDDCRQGERGDNER